MNFIPLTNHLHFHFHDDVTKPKYVRDLVSDSPPRANGKKFTSDASTAASRNLSSSAVSWTWKAAAFFSTYLKCLVPGMGKMSSPKRKRCQFHTKLVLEQISTRCMWILVSEPATSTGSCVDREGQFGARIDLCEYFCELFMSKIWICRVHMVYTSLPSTIQCISADSISSGHYLGDGAMPAPAALA